MKLYSKIIISSTLLILLISCNNLPFTMKGSGNVVTKNRNLNLEFDKVTVSSGIQLNIDLAQENSITVVADDNIQQHLITEIENGELKIYFNKNISNIKSRIVNLKTPKISSIKANGGSSVTNSKPLKSKFLNLKATQGSLIDLEVNCRKILTDLSSGAEIKLEGKVEKLIANASSGSHIKASSLTARNCSITASSGANININCENELIATANSGSNIEYIGKPETKHCSANSGGNISNIKQ